MAGRLLLIDDEEDVLGIVSEFLAAVGYEVVAVHTGRRARDLIAGEGPPFDLALVDWALPDLSGRDLVLALERHQPACAVLVTTGHGDDVVSDTMIGAQVDGILRKPFTMQGLRLRIEELLQARSA